MRSKRVIADRGGGGTYTLPEHREAYADDFASESDALMPDNTIPWEKNAESTQT